MRRGRWLLLVGVLGMGGCGWIATPIDYRCQWCTQEAYAHSGGALVSQDEFTDRRIIATFRRYLAEVPNDKLTEFAIGPSLEDIGGMGSSYGGNNVGYSNPADRKVNFNRVNRNVAKLFRFNKSSVALIKRGDKVKKIQLLGSQDPNVFYAGSHEVHLESFGLMPGYERRTVIFGIPERDLSEAEANEVFRAVSGALGNEDNVDLVLRSDGIFWAWDGPGFYPFALRVPNVPEERYYANQFFYCSGSHYPGRHGCHAGHEVKPKPFIHVD
jgi:hypothetical protein